MKVVTIIDYKEGGNLFSVNNSLEYLGVKTTISSNPDEILKASKVIFPGVGSFTKAINQITNLDLKEAIKSKALSGDPFMGICVGMQVLFESSSETHGANDSDIAGLGILKAKVEKFPENQEFKIPQIGWNAISLDKERDNPLFKGINDGAFFYFVHSFMVNYSYTASLLKQFPQASFTKTDYSCPFISSYWNGENLFACQFHPEKSAENGLKVLENFVGL